MAKPGGYFSDDSINELATALYAIGYSNALTDAIANLPGLTPAQLIWLGRQRASKKGYAEIVGVPMPPGDVIIEEARHAG